MWQHSGGPVGSQPLNRVGCAVPAAPPGARARPSTFGSRGIPVRPVSVERCLSGPRPDPSPACWSWGRSHEPLSRLRMGGGSPRGAASSGAAARGSWGHPSGCLTASGASTSTHRLRAGRAEADEGVKPCRVLRVPSGDHSDGASDFMLDHRCQPSGAERWVATTLRGRRDVPETEHLRVRRAGYGGFPRDLSRRPDGLRVIPGAAWVDLRDDLACDRS